MDAEFIDLTAENIADEHLCCIIRMKKPHTGVEAKREWLAARLPEGHVFRKLNTGHCVFIEYAPLETAWVPVVGENYLYIYCLWVLGAPRGSGRTRRGCWCTTIFSVHSSCSAWRNCANIARRTVSLPRLSWWIRLKRRSLCLACSTTGQHSGTAASSASTSLTARRWKRSSAARPSLDKTWAQDYHVYNEIIRSALNETMHGF